MRTRLALICCGLLLPLAGCNWFHDNVLHPNSKKPVTASDQRPTKDALVAYVNNESAKVNSLQVNNLAIEASMGYGVARSIALNGSLEAQKPRNFRLEGYIPAAKTDMVDLGSNDREFWFWVGDAGRSKDTPYLYHCSHTDLPKAQLPIPVHPDWIMEALGMSPVPVGANVKMEFAKDGRTIDLIEPTRSPQGQPMYKVTVFNARTVSGTEPQIVARKLVDTRGKLVCLAEIKEMQQDLHNPSIKVPRIVKLTYPAERELDKIQLTLVMENVAVNTPVDRAMADIWFTRPQKAGVQSLDLATQGRDASYRGQSSAPPSGGGAGLFRPRGTR
jgi:hypothetical protein